MSRLDDCIDCGWVIKTGSSYVDRKIVIRHADGMLSEVQIWTPQIH